MLSFLFKKCVFLGYRSLHRGYKCLDTDSGRVYISRDVIFDDNVFPFNRALPSCSPTLQPTHNAPDLCTLHLGNSRTNLENDHMHISMPTNSFDAESLVPTSASGFPQNHPRPATRIGICCSANDWGLGSSTSR